MRIYVAGPYSQGDVRENVARAIAIGNVIARRGHTPFIPHLTHFWHLQHPHPVGFWYAQDMEWLRQCDALYRIPGPSEGADNEVAECLRLGRPVFTELEEIPGSI